MDYLVSLDSSRDLQSICVKSFVNKFHLVFQISKILSQNFAFLCFCVYGVGTKHTLILMDVGLVSLSYLQYIAVGYEFIQRHNTSCKDGLSS